MPKQICRLFFYIFLFYLHIIVDIYWLDVWNPRYQVYIDKLKGLLKKLFKINTFGPTDPQLHGTYKSHINWTLGMLLP